jgi:glycopeptide antibiotics resistance protein
MLSANVLVVVTVAVVVGIIVGGRARTVSAETLVARCALTGAVAWILALTIFPIPIEARGWAFHRPFSNMSLVPFRSIEAALAHGLVWSEARQLFGNIALFAPFGLLLPLSLRTFRRLWRTILVAAGLSVLIETMQSLLPEHSTDIDDVTLNASGAALGYLAFVLIRWVRRAVEERTDLERLPSSMG